MNEVLDRILLTMKEQHLSAKELCLMTDISQSTFATWKAKDREPKPTQLQRIAEALNVSAEYLLTGEEQKKHVHYLDDDVAELAQALFENREMRSLFSAARDADADSLRLAYDLLLALKKKERGE